MLVEIICTTVQEAIDAERAGADRLELVTGIKEGGLTPSIALISEVCNAVSIPVHVMIRPHSKSFIYNESEKRVMISDIKYVRGTNAAGIVIGSLTSNNVVDRNFLDEVVSIKGDLKIAYHRAIDSSVNYEKDIKYLLDTDIDVILTSAGKNSIVDAGNEFTDIVKLSYTKTVTILGGSGINLENAFDIVEKHGLRQIHIGSAAKYHRDNLNEIDVESLSEFIKKIKA